MTQDWKRNFIFQS